MKQLEKIHPFHIFNRPNPVPVYLSWEKKKKKWKTLYLTLCKHLWKLFMTLLGVTGFYKTYIFHPRVPLCFLVLTFKIWYVYMLFTYVSVYICVYVCSAIMFHKPVENLWLTFKILATKMSIQSPEFTTLLQEPLLCHSDSNWNTTDWIERLKLNQVLWPQAE